MNPKIKNIIIFSAVAVALILIYVFFFRSSPKDQALLTASNNSDSQAADTGNMETVVGSDFISLLLNIKSIKLDDSIFADPGFVSLKDSSITLTQDGTEGRSNPFAPIGVEVAPTQPSSTSVGEGIIEAAPQVSESTTPTGTTGTQPTAKTGTKKN